MNGAPMAHHGLTSSEDGAIPSRMLFALPPGLQRAHFSLGTAHKGGIGKIGKIGGNNN